MATQLDIISIDGSIYNLIAIDIGNSAIKLYGNSKLLRFSYRTNWEQDLSLVFSGLNNRLCLFVVSSVNKEKSQVLETMLDSFPNFRVIKANELIPKQNLIDTSKLQGIGTDRILGLIGAKFYAEPPILTIDCGTATTINLLNENNECLGGAILPGIFTQFRSLTENTSALKKIKLKQVDEQFGKNTNDAISSGIINGTIAVINHFINQAKIELGGRDINIFLTGGNSIWIAEKMINLYPNINHNYTLVLEGLKFLAKNHFNK